MNAFALKLIALISMFIDHSSFVFYIHRLFGENMYIFLRGVGRLAFPIYCFLLVNGFQHSSDKGKYLYRLMLFALISQIPFSLAFSISNYYGAALGRPLFSFGGLLYIVPALLFLAACLTRKEKKVSHIITICLFALLPGITLKFGTLTLIGSSLNVFFTLAIGLSVISLIHGMEEKTLTAPVFITSLLAVSSALIIIQTKADYGLLGIILISLLYVLRKSRAAQAVALGIWACVQYGFNGANLIFTLFALLSLIPVLLYNGRKGPSLKFFFYIFYPAHLLLLALISFIL